MSMNAYCPLTPSILFGPTLNTLDLRFAHTFQQVVATSKEFT